jgi:hypothetical protein
LFSQTSALPPVFFKFLCSGLAARAANSAEGKALR